MYVCVSLLSAYVCLFIQLTPITKVSKYAYYPEVNSL